MLKLFKTKRFYALAFLALICVFVARTFYVFGELRTITPHYHGKCMEVQGIPGAEDATFDPKTGLAFISSYDRRLWAAGKDAPGAIYSLDIDSTKPIPKNLTASFSEEFHPHGISLYADASGKTLIFAINHKKAYSSVEIFEYVGGLLKHRETIADPLMWRPNDLQAVGPRSFYVSNDHASRSSLGRFFEDFIPLKKSYLLYFDGSTMTYAATDIGQANGVNTNADGSLIFLSATTEQAIKVFRRDRATGSLTPTLSIPLGGFPDNIEVDRAGRLYVASMPKGLTNKAHSFNADIAAPTRILRVTLGSDTAYSIEELYADDGSNINAATVAAPFDEGMLLGPSKDKKNQVLICRAKR